MSKRKCLAKVFSGLMLCGGWAAAAPPPVAGDTLTNAEVDVRVWGDPEDTQVVPADWTWFGMGYERRNQAGSAGPADTPDGTGRSRGPGAATGKSGR